jgi:hypothetical protein
MSGRICFLMAEPINNIHETGEWFQNFIEVTMISLNKKPKATKRRDHGTYS